MNRKEGKVSSRRRQITQQKQREERKESVAQWREACFAVCLPAKRGTKCHFFLFFPCSAEPVSDGCHYPTQWAHAGDISAAPDEASCGVGGGGNPGSARKMKRESGRVIKTGERAAGGGRRMKGG